jgi:hypothetical protein
MGRWSDRSPRTIAQCRRCVVPFAGCIGGCVADCGRPVENITELFASAVPTASECVAIAVLPVSLEKALIFGAFGASAVVCRLKVSEAVPLLPAASVSLATTVCEPSANPAGVNVQAPLTSAVDVPAIANPSNVKCTTASGSPVPLSASFDVIYPSMTKLRYQG